MDRRTMKRLRQIGDRERAREAKELQMAILRGLPTHMNRPDADDERRHLPISEIPVGPDNLGFPPGEMVKAYRLGECTVIITREFGQWHLSINHAGREPTWAEISQARYRLLPDDITMVMLLPPRREYVNINKNVFQLVQLQED